MVQDCTGGCEAVSDLLVLERADEHFFDGGKSFFQRTLSVQSYSLKSAAAVSKV